MRRALALLGLGLTALVMVPASSVAADAGFGGCPAGYDGAGVGEGSLLLPADVDGDSFICTTYPGSEKPFLSFAVDDNDPATSGYTCKAGFGAVVAVDQYANTDRNGNGILCARLVYTTNGAVLPGDSPGNQDHGTLVVRDD